MKDTLALTDTIDCSVRLERCIHTMARAIPLPARYLLVFISIYPGFTSTNANASVKYEMQDDNDKVDMQCVVTPKTQRKEKQPPHRIDWE